MTDNKTHFHKIINVIKRLLVEILLEDPIRRDRKAVLAHDVESQGCIAVFEVDWFPDLGGSREAVAHLVNDALDEWYHFRDGSFGEEGVQSAAPDAV